MGGSVPPASSRHRIVKNVERMQQRIAAVALLVPEYDAGIAFFCGVLGFELVEDTRSPPGSAGCACGRPAGGTALLLARAAT